MRSRSAWRMARDLVAYGVGTGRWWFVVVAPVLALAVLLALTAKAVVGPVVYVFF